LKLSRDEPDASQAAAVGMEEGGDANAGEAEVAINQTPQELLRSLPGIVSCRRCFRDPSLEADEYVFLRRPARITAIS
jgi:hypothetical protein